MSHFAVLIAISAWWLCAKTEAQITYSGTTSADAFLATGSRDNPAGADLTGENFGAAGTMVVASPASTNGEFQSVMRFNLADAAGLFNTNFGAGNWQITGFSLQLTSNYGAQGQQPNNAIFPVINGGQFVIEWLSNDTWVEGSGKPNMVTTDGVTYNSLPDLLSGPHEILGTNTYVPPGDNVPVTYPLPLSTNLIGDVAAGGDANFLLFAADNQISYLFNSREFGRGNQPMILVTAVPMPPTITAGYFINANFHITGKGAPNLSYQVQANTNLSTTNWQSLGTATADGTGLIQFDDTTAPGQAQRYYRLAR
jgi:hypothetical protein